LIRSGLTPTEFPNPASATPSDAVSVATCFQPQPLPIRPPLRSDMRCMQTGIVVVGRIGTDLHMEYTAIGGTINLASRLQSLARPGSVLTSDSTPTGVSDFFETLELGELEIKGHASVRAFEVLGPHGRRARLDLAVERGLTPLVGRDRPLDIRGTFHEG
jgi:class 3 adenylate cyclase